MIAIDFSDRPNKPDAANPAKAPRLHSKAHWRRVADLERYALKVAARIVE